MSGDWLGDILVRADGTVAGVWPIREPQLLPSFAPFNHAIADAVRQWQYEPWRPGGRATPFCATVGVTVTTSSLIPLAALLIAVAALGLFAQSAHFWRIRKGMCVVRHTSSGETTLATDLGDFTLTREHLLVKPIKGNPRAVSMATIRALRFRTSYDSALLADLLYDFSLWDLSRKWRDRIKWHEISLVTTDGDLPLFVAGQIEHTEYYLEAWAKACEHLLRWCGLRKYVDDESQQALATLRKVFELAGKPLPLA